MDLHIERLRKAHGYFSKRDEGRWAKWVGDDALWDTVKGKLEEKEKEGRGDWRVSEMIAIDSLFAKES